MADRFPLILNTSANQIQEIASGDGLDLTNTNISNAGIITASSFSGPIVAGAGVSNITSGIGTFTDLRVGGDTSFSEDFVVTGNARVTGILTVGTSSIILNDSTDTIKVGTALTLGHTQGLQFHTQNLHSAGFDVNQINVSGASTIGGNLDANGDLDVDGHTNLDNVSIAGVTTFTGNIGGTATFKDIDVDGHTNLDNINIAGVTTTTGVFVINAGTESTSTTTGALRVAGGVGIVKNLYVGGILDSDGPTHLDYVSISGVTTHSDTVHIIDDKVLMFGSGGDSTIEYDENGTDQLTIAGAVTRFTNTTQSTSKDTGSVILEGGLGVEKNLSVGGNVSIGGTLTYEDVTNIDSVGIVTARNGLKVLAGGANVVGVLTATAGMFVPDNNQIQLGNAAGSADLKIYHQSSNNHSYISETGSGSLIVLADDFYVQDTSTATMISAKEGAEVNLHFNGNAKLATSNTGVTITGTATATTFSGSGASLTNLPAANLSGTAAAINGSNITNLNGSNIASGTVPVARIGTGTKSASTFYRGDGTFATVTAAAITGLSNASNNRVLTSEGGTTVNAEANLEFDGTNLFIGPNYVPKLSSGADNRVTTATGANAIQGEANLLFDGTHLALGNTPGDHYYSRGIAVHAAGTGAVLHLTDSNSGTGQSNGFDIISHNNDAYLWQRETGNMIFGIGGQSKWSINNAGDFFPSNNGTQDIGSSGARVQNIYTNDLHLSNEGSTNSVDNTWGDYTIQEGESDLFLINNRSGKKYKFNLTEVS